MSNEATLKINFNEAVIEALFKAKLPVPFKMGNKVVGMVTEIRKVESEVAIIKVIDYSDEFKEMVSGGYMFDEDGNVGYVKVEKSE